MKRRFVSCLTFACWTLGVCAVEKPTPPAPLGARILAPLKGEKTLPVVFTAGDNKRRVAYDFPLRLALATNEVFAIDVAVTDVRMTTFTLYLKSGKGWYVLVRRLGEESVGNWTRLDIARSDFLWVEGKPAGWNRIDGLRIAVYRPLSGAAFSGSLGIANFGKRPAPSAASPEVKRHAAEVAAFAPKAEAWAKSLRGKAGERRLMWCHSPLGLKGDGDWASSVKTLKSFGYTDLIANLVWGGCTDYRSKVARETRVVAKQGDMLDAALAACRANGVKLHVWNVCWPMSRNLEKSFADELDRQGRLQYDAEGRRVRTNQTDWLCPSSPENRAFVAKIMIELAERGVDGVHFDYIRYPGEAGCFCAKCRERFEAKIGAACSAWPRDVERGGPHRDAWVKFRVANITALVKDVAKVIHARFPKVEVSAAVFRDPETDPVTVGQDWASWLRQGDVDFICPMDYTWNLGTFRDTILRQKAAVGLKGVYPGIGLTSSARFPQDGGDAYRFSEQVLEVRAAGFAGFTCFNFDSRCARAMEVARQGVLAAQGGDTHGETLYNGLVLPATWPPKIDINDNRPVPAPYLDEANIPKVIPIDVGRQLFVDDFLVASTAGVKRVFFKPRKFHANPVLWPETTNELALATALGRRPYPRKADGSRDIPWNPNVKTAPCCYTSGGGFWFDPTRKVYRLWYMAGWSHRLAYAESKDLIHWTRPAVGIAGTNILRDEPAAWDTWSVFPNYAAANPYGDWKLYQSYGGNPGSGIEYESADGLAWRQVARCGLAGDASTMFYNPFRGKWVWSLRSVWRGRSRNYREHDDFVKGAAWHFPMGGTAADGSRPFYIAGKYTNTCDVANWLACDNRDLPRTLNGRTYTNAQLYNFDAVAYESVMVGLHKIMCGRDNEEAARSGMPKTTEVHFGFSRDGFHFDRPDRTAAIGDSGWGSGEWDAGYLSPVSGGFAIKDEELWFLYAGVRGDAGEIDPPRCTTPNGMHCNGSIGAAILRRDGFAGLVADGFGEVTTRPVKFAGSHFFVNADARFGRLAVEVLDAGGHVIPGYAAADCRTLDHVNATKRAVSWKGGDLKRFAGKAVRFRFKMNVSTLYAFWVSRKPTGESGGYVAAGGPAYAHLKDE